MKAFIKEFFTKEVTPCERYEMEKYLGKTQPHKYKKDELYKMSYKRLKKEYENAVSEIAY